MRLPALLLLSVPFVSGANNWVVGVGKDETTGKKGIGFDPSVINPVAGDTIIFEFRSGSHSVVQTTFENPCVPLADGFNTGVKKVDDSLSVDAQGLPTVNLLVNDTQSIWLFDQAAGTCNQGGVLSVNPTGTQSAAAFKEAASKATVPSTSSETSESSTSTSTDTTQSGPSNTGSPGGASAFGVPSGAIFTVFIGIMGTFVGMLI